MIITVILTVFIIIMVIISIEFYRYTKRIEYLKKNYYKI